MLEIHIWTRWATAQGVYLFPIGWRLGGNKTRPPGLHFYFLVFPKATLHFPQNSVFLFTEIKNQRRNRKK